MKAKTKIKKTGWDFKRDGITQGFIHYFINCREQTRLKYKGRWSSYAQPLYREFGSCFHWLLGQIYGHNKIPQNQTVVKKMLRQYHILWKKQNPRPRQKILQQQDLVYGLCEIVLPAYLKRYDGDFTGKYKLGYNVVRPIKWIASEEVWTLDYTYDNGFLHVPIHGRFDQVFDDKRKRPWLLETKCLSVIYEDDIADTLPEDIQCLLYLLAINLKFKKKPAGVLYNIVRRPGQRQGKDETLKDFLVRVEKDVTNPKRQDHYFKRIEMAISWSEIEAWQKNFLDVILMEIRDWDMGTARHWMNPDALTSKYGRCELFDMLVNGDKTKYHQRKVIFNELQDNI